MIICTTLAAGLVACVTQGALIEHMARHTILDCKAAYAAGLEIKKNEARMVRDFGPMIAFQNRQADRAYEQQCNRKVR